MNNSGSMLLKQFVSWSLLYKINKFRMATKVFNKAPGESEFVQVCYWKDHTKNREKLFCLTFSSITYYWHSAQQRESSLIE